MPRELKQDTLADICQKIRDAGIPELADHILAAWKRERAEIEAQALSIGGIVESSRHTQKPQGNAAALLEALRALRDASRDFYNQILNSKYSEILDKYTCAKQGFPAVLHVKAAIVMANRALVAPARNCEVGTPEEQEQRFYAFCDTYRNCGGCPHIGLEECALAWAQLPYSDGTANRGDLCHED